MKKLIYLVAFVATITLASCEKLTIGEPYQEGIILTNIQKLDGTYTITGPHGFFYQGQSLTAPTQGEYNAYFINQKVDGNVCKIDGKRPTYLGTTKFTVTTPSQTEKISVPISQITCEFKFKVDDSIEILGILLSGTSDKIFVDDGQFVDNSPTKELVGDQYNNDIHVIASKMEIQITIRTSEPKYVVLTKEIDAQPAHCYAVKIGKNGIHISE